MPTIRVKNTAELHKVTGRPPVAPPKPAAPASAPAPAPKPAAPAPAAPVIDHEARALLRANSDQLRALTELLAKQAQQQPAPVAHAPVPAAPPAPAPQPAPAPAAPPRFIDMPLRPPAAAPIAQAGPKAAPAPEPVGPIVATVARDKKDRLAAVSITGAATMQAGVTRDLSDRISEMTITKNGKRYHAIVARDRKKRIETITLHPAKP